MRRTSGESEQIIQTERERNGNDSSGHTYNTHKHTHKHAHTHAHRTYCLRRTWRFQTLPRWLPLIVRRSKASRNRRSWSPWWSSGRYMCARERRRWTGTTWWSRTYRRKCGREPEVPWWAGWRRASCQQQRPAGERDFRLRKRKTRHERERRGIWERGISIQLANTLRLILSALVRLQWTDCSKAR